MKIDVLPLGIYQVNCYICSDEETKRCVLIDPGAFTTALTNFLQENELKPAAVLLTHAHFDHVGGVKALAEAFRIPVYICEKDTVLPEKLTAGPLCYTDTYETGDTVKIDSMEFRVMETPGHTPGSVCLICGDCLFCGDTLFAGSCGRTDLFGGDHATILNSLRDLAALKGDYTVLPGHGPATLLSRERAYNPFMKGL